MGERWILFRGFSTLFHASLFSVYAERGSLRVEGVWVHLSSEMECKAREEPSLLERLFAWVREKFRAVADIRLANIGNDRKGKINFKDWISSDLFSPWQYKNKFLLLIWLNENVPFFSASNGYPNLRRRFSFLLFPIFPMT
jgi:hypothetical protein